MSAVHIKLPAQQSSADDYVSMVDQVRPKSAKHWGDRLKQVFARFTGFFMEKPIELTIGEKKCKSPKSDFLGILYGYAEAQGIGTNEVTHIVSKHIGNCPLTGRQIRKVDDAIKRYDAIRRKLIERGIKAGFRSAEKVLQKQIDSTTREEITNLLFRTLQKCRVNELSAEAIEDQVLPALLSRELEQTLLSKHNIDRFAREDEENTKKIIQQAQEFDLDNDTADEKDIPSDRLLKEQNSYVTDLFCKDAIRGWKLYVNGSTLDLSNTERTKDADYNYPIIRTQMVSIIPNPQQRGLASSISNQFLDTGAVSQQLFNSGFHALAVGMKTHFNPQTDGSVKVLTESIFYLDGTRPRIENNRVVMIQYPPKYFSTPEGEKAKRPAIILKREFTLNPEQKSMKVSDFQSTFSRVQWHEYDKEEEAVQV